MTDPNASFLPDPHIEQSARPNQHAFLKKSRRAQTLVLRCTSVRYCVVLVSDVTVLSQNACVVDD